MAFICKPNTRSAAAVLGSVVAAITRSVASITWPVETCRGLVREPARARARGRAAPPMSSVVACDFDAACFLHADGKLGSTSWKFLSDLETSGVPAKISEFLQQTSSNACDMRAKANVMLNNGLLGEYVDMLEIAESLEQQLDRIVYKVQSAAPRHRKLRDSWKKLCKKQLSQHADGVAAVEALAQRVSHSLRHEHHAIVDGFLPNIGDVGLALRLSLIHI